MAGPKLMKPEEISDRLGIPLDVVKEYVRTQLVKGSQGLYSIDDILAIRDAGLSLKDLPTLVAEHAALKAEVMRQRQLFQFVLRVAGLQQHTREFSDSQLLQLLALARSGASGFGPVNLRTLPKIKYLIDAVCCLTDLDLRRLESLTSEPRCWRFFIFLIEDLNDTLADRPDFLEHAGVRALRMELALARQQVANQGKFLLALADPYTDPRKLLNEICARAAKLELLDTTTTGFEPGVVLEQLLNFVSDRSV